MRGFSFQTITEPMPRGYQLAGKAFFSASLSQSQASWTWYQEWNNLIFLHWKIPSEILKPLIPSELILDTFYGSCMITLVAYTMNNIRHINTPAAIPHISDFHQVNIRTYVVKDDKPGIYIFHIKAEKSITCFSG